MRSMTGKAPKRSRNDCSMTPKSSEKLAYPASPEKLASFSKLFRLSSNAPLAALRELLQGAFDDEKEKLGKAKKS